ncbi:uridine phosphorylase [Longilinea arvoryzae]|uniref:Uridine phosphorylase n=1 Tax=Longilinea arvoryzae TaxID=360412 RepID=A0A0S7BKA8_9CHLR|nr:nucleoside phosphorylase [Longilinea arvoryzae]GAP15536.1 uridine phosphorylase [Longilinea arvoryzae]
MTPSDLNPEFPLFEFDPDPAAILNPQVKLRLENPPQRWVLCFFREVLDSLAQSGELRKVGELRSEAGANPIYQVEQDGTSLLVMHPGVGAPLAVGFMEEAISCGGRHFIACGGCGVLKRDIAVGHPVVITSAVRDEGTSYHYLPPTREAAASPAAVAALEETLRNRKVDYRLGKSWTTDAIYRETKARRTRRVEEGCLVVEMEASAFFALAQFRGVTCGQVVYGGDLVTPEGWDFRDWIARGDVRTALFWLAVEACSKLG